MRRRRPAWLLVLLPLLAAHCTSNSTGASLSVTVLEPAEGALVLDDALDVRANVACGSDQALECGLRSHVQLCIGIGAHDTHVLPLRGQISLRGRCVPFGDVCEHYSKQSLPGRPTAPVAKRVQTLRCHVAEARRRA